MQLVPSKTRQSKDFFETRFIERNKKPVSKCYDIKIFDQAGAFKHYETPMNQE